MGGTYTLPGNITSTAEFNIYADPENARRVIRSSIPKTMVGLDVTHKVILTPRQLLPDLEKMKQRNADLLRRMILFAINFNQRVHGIDGCYLHDPLAVGVALDPTLVQTRELALDVELQGELTRGMTVADLRSPGESEKNCRVCTHVDTERFMDLFINRVLMYVKEQLNG